MTTATTATTATPPSALLGLFDGLRSPDGGQRLDATEGIATARLLALATGGSALFGLATGLYGMSIAQIGASALKLPLVLLGATALCFPAFFLAQTVLAPKALSLPATLRLHAGAAAITAATWAALALPCSLMLASAQDYTVTKVLVTLIAAAGGAAGMSWFVRGFAAAASTPERRPGAALPVAYSLLYGIVGMQLAWSLRPFIGSPSQAFTWFRPLGGNLIENLLSSIAGGA